MDSIAEDCFHAIASAKGIPRDSITLDSPLQSLDLDSLDRVSMAFDLEEKYGIELPEHKLYSVVTVGDLVHEINLAINAKATGNPAA